MVKQVKQVASDTVAAESQTLRFDMNFSAPTTVADPVMMDSSSYDAPAVRTENNPVSLLVVVHSEQVA